MKTKLLILGILFCFLFAPSLYAQEIKTVEKKEIRQIKKINPPKAQVKKERILPGIIDTITGEQIPPYESLPPSKRLAVIFPPPNQQYPNSNFYNLGESVIENSERNPAVQLHGEGPAGRTVEVKMLRLDGSPTLIQDWTPIPNKINPNGYWGAAIKWGTPSDIGQTVKLRVSVREARNKTNVITFDVGRE